MPVIQILQFFALACIIGTNQCGDDLLAAHNAPLEVKYATDPTVGFHNVSEFVAHLATRPHSKNDGYPVKDWEELRIYVKPVKADPDLIQRINEAMIADSGVIGPARHFIWGKDGNSHVETVYPLNSRGQ